MKKKIYFIALVITLTIINFSCKFESPINAANDVTLSGQVIESITEDPIANVSIRITDGIRQVDVTTDAQGVYSTTFSISENKNLNITISKDGYLTETMKQYVRLGTDVTIPLIKLLKTNINITGKVIDLNSENSVKNASVIVTDGNIQASTVTNGSGEFSLDFYMIKDKKITIITSKDGFCSDTLTYNATVGEVIEIPLTTLINDVTLKGQVVESVTSIPIFNALIKITDGSTEVSTRTDENGIFTAKFPNKEDKELLIITSKEAYTTDTLKLFAEVGKSYLQIKRVIKQSGGPGNLYSPASIYLFSQSSESIGVKESGSNETAKIWFEVLDGTGVPINSGHSITLNFNFGGHPGGGEFLYPSSVQTNELGRGMVTLNSGTKVGVAQVIAQMTVNGSIIMSRPVLISIHSGFPDQNHFEIWPDRWIYDYPYYNEPGHKIIFHMYVGDKYSNPVRPGTSVHFETTSGSIEGSSLTDSLGTASVTLFNGVKPNLNESGYGDGYFKVTASTDDENNNLIKTSVIIHLH